MNRQKIALILAAISTVLVVFGWIGIAKIGYGGTMVLIGTACGLISYVFAGLGMAFRMARSIGRIGWVGVPFPVCLISGLVTALFAFCAILFIPIIPVFKAYRESGSY